MTCVFIAATVPMEKEGAVNPLLEAAKNIGEPQTEDDEQEKTPAKNEPAVGSYERFMHSFGNPSRWAGRS